MTRLSTAGRTDTRATIIVGRDIASIRVLSIMEIATATITRRLCTGIIGRLSMVVGYAVLMAAPGNPIMQAGKDERIPEPAGHGSGIHF